MPLKHPAGRLIPAILFVTAIALFLGACGDRLLDVEFENDPAGNFDALWNEFDRYYAAFDVRHVDWDSLYTLYRPLVNDGSTGAELNEAMAGLLAHLQDEHVSLYASGFPIFQSGSDKEKLLFSDSDPDSLYSDKVALIYNAVYEYLDSIYVGCTDYDLPAYFSWHGTISPDHTSLRLGYIFVSTFELAEAPTAYYDSVVKAFADYDGVIIDIRINSGGSSGTSSALINRFTDRERAYSVSRYRNGPNHGDFTVPKTEYLSPTDNTLGDIPVAVLTSSLTGSAAEAFTLGAKVLPMASVVGDTTIGILGGVAKKVLPNGWEFKLSPELRLSIDGACYEGIGIPPDIHVIATRAGVDTGIDSVIDRAIEILESTASGLSRNERPAAAICRPRQSCRCLPPVPPAPARTVIRTR